jgi:uncharacterized iron-regulated membrane protein
MLRSMTRLYLVTTAALTGIIGVLLGLLLAVPRNAGEARAPVPTGHRRSPRRRSLGPPPRAR